MTAFIFSSTMCVCLDGSVIMLLIDCLNSSYVERHPVYDELQIVNGVEFGIQRACENEYFLKDIRISDPGRLEEKQFTERTQA